MLASLITVAGTFVMMIYISPVLMLVMLVTIPMTLFYTRYRVKKVKPLFRKRSAKLGELNGFVEEMLSGQKTIKAYAAEDTIVERFDNVNEETVDAYYTAEYYGSLTWPTVHFINNLSLALVTVFGAMLYLRGALTLGSISAFIQYSRKFSGPINETANIITELQSAVAAAERVFKLIDQEPELVDAEGAKELEEVEGDVTLENISFGYTANQTIIKNLFLKAKPGSLTAIVGPTGAGKHNNKFGLRFYDVEMVTYMLMGMRLNRTRRSLRKSYAKVLQDTWLFTGTVYDNIAYGKDNASKEEVITAQTAGIHSSIKRLPKVRTVINEDG